MKTTRNRYTVDALCLAYMTHAKIRYREKWASSPEFDYIVKILDIMTWHCGNTPTDEISLGTLVALPGIKWSIRRNVVRQVFRWGVQNGMVPRNVYRTIFERISSPSKVPD